MTPPPPIDALRGALVLCDYVSLMAGGKWLVAGTYTNHAVPPGLSVLDCPGLQAYVRILTEAAGRYHGRILLINRALPSNLKPIHETTFDVEIADPLNPVEFGWKSPAFSVQSPIDPATLPAGSAFGLPLLLWLEVDGKALASTPLNIIFRPPQGPPHAGDDPGQPDLRRAP